MLDDRKNVFKTGMRLQIPQALYITIITIIVFIITIIVNIIIIIIIIPIILIIIISPMAGCYPRSAGNLSVCPAPAISLG